MKLKILLSLLSVFFTLGIYSEEKQPAFPGAEGYGRYVTGGRGGTVYYVTNLNDSGTGSFRWAVSQKGKRTIMFKVSGTIFLKSSLSISNGDVTIAGQSAPGDGICLADYPVSIHANNVIVRYMRFRVGNFYVTQDGADGWDGFGGMDQQNIMIDHCSVSWSIDECLSVLGNKNSTVQWCISSHSLVNAGHSKGAHGYGGNWGGNHASFHHNLMAHHVSRTPRLGPRASTQLEEHMDMRNNVIYNWAGNGCYGGEGMDVNIVNNYYKPGPATLQCSSTIQKRIAAVSVRTNEYVTTYPAYAPALHKWGHFYVDGNMNSEWPSVAKDNWTNGFYNQIDASGNDGTYTATTKDTIKLTEPINFIYTTTHTADVAYNKVLDYVGCSLHRDSYDAEVVSDVLNGTASHTGDGLKPGQINSQEDLMPADASSEWSAWPTLNSTTAPTDTDGDGMPDQWEMNNGLDDGDATDGAKVCSDGYTNLEHYLNSLVAKITEAQNADGEAIGDVEEVTSTPTEPYVINATTSDGSGNFTTEGATFSCSSLTTPSGIYMKYSRNRDYTFSIPDGVSISKINVKGYLNVDSGDGYLWKVGNKTVGSKGAANEYHFRSRKAAGAGDDNYTFEFTPALTKSFIIDFTGDGQGCLSLTLYPESQVAGIDNVQSFIPMEEGHKEVFNLSGQRVSDSYKGIIIQKGKKYLSK